MLKSTHFSPMLHNNSSTFFAIAILACNAYDSNAHLSLKANLIQLCLGHNKAIYMIFNGDGGIVIEKLLVSKNDSELSRRCEKYRIKLF